MSPADAAKLLEVPADASPEQLEARFLELRRRFEDKIAKAPTPGLQAKYRESLTEITTAFETLMLAADSSALPVLDKQSAVNNQPSAKPAEPAPHPQSAVRTPPSKKSGGKEFLVVALIAVALLAAGGWWVMKTKAENEEKVRIATEQKIAADRRAEEARLGAEAQKKIEEEEKARIAAATKAEQERRDKQLALLRSRLAQLNVHAESLFQEEPSKAARRLSELKSDERSLAREKESGDLARLRAQVDAQQGYLDALDTLLTRHPAKSTQARATELVSARETESASEAVEQLAAQLEKLDALMGEARERRDTALHGTLQIENPYLDVQWSFTDAFGEKRTGSGGDTIPSAGIGTGTLEFKRRGWPAARQNVLIRRGAVATVTADFRPARLTIASTPPDATFRLSNGATGKTPAEIEVIPGRVQLSIAADGHSDFAQEVALENGETRAITAQLKPDPLWTQAEAEEFGASITNFVNTGFAYQSKIYAVPGPDGKPLSVVVSSAMPVNLVPPPFPAPPPAALRQKGQPFSVTYGMWSNNRWIGTGARGNNPHMAPVAEQVRPNCGGIVYIAGMYEPGSGRWVMPPAVFATSHHDLVAAAQHWANSLRVTSAGPAPTSQFVHYRVFFVVKFPPL